MGSFDSINPLPPITRIRPRTVRVPQRKPRKDRQDPRSRKRPDAENNDDGKPHIDEYA